VGEEGDPIFPLSQLASAPGRNFQFGAIDRRGLLISASENIEHPTLAF
jgi:hypothetical protein